MIEQGLAQQRMWKTGDASIEAGLNGAILDPEADRLGRGVIHSIGDVVVIGKEVDLALEER